jgi:hypothetical protein
MMRDRRTQPERVRRTERRRDDLADKAENRRGEAFADRRSVAHEARAGGERKTPERDKSGGRPPSERARDAADVC